MIADSTGDRSGDTRPLWITGLSPPDSSLRQPGYLQLNQVRTPKHCVWGYDRTLKVRNFRSTKVGNFQSQLTRIPPVRFLAQICGSMIASAMPSIISTRMSERTGELLVESGCLELSELDRALRLQTESGQRLGTLLVSLGLVTDRDLAKALAERLSLEVTPSHAYGAFSGTEAFASPEFLKQVLALPVSEHEDHVVVAFGDPLDQYAQDALRLALGCPIVVQVGVISEIEAAIERLYGDGATAIARIAHDVRGEEERDRIDIQHLRDLASEAPIIRIVNLLIARSIDAGASDIHVEPFEARLRVRYRIDGVLREVEAPPVRSTAAVTSRIKVMANLNIAERRLPQDGRIRARIEGREVDMRISCVPTMHGESIVMRILDEDSVALDFDALGFRGSTYETLKRLLDAPQGLVLVTGPTGSGKTTTLYAALQSLNAPGRKIVTVEDPVEYQLEGINQITVRPQIELTFAVSLRSILRQDPDIIMVGEMRDPETAKIAVQSALTGHKVFSTLHTNDAASSVTRLLDMGVEDYLVASTLNGVIAQRLVRTLCAHCKRPHEAQDMLIDTLNLSHFADEAPIALYRPVGCARCDGTGYQGRTGIVEVLVMTEALRRAVLEHRDASGIWRTALKDGAVSMHADGLAKAVRGVTAVEEVHRVIQAG